MIKVIPTNSLKDKINTNTLILKYTRIFKLNFLYYKLSTFKAGQVNKFFLTRKVSLKIIC